MVMDIDINRAASLKETKRAKAETI